MSKGKVFLVGAGPGDYQLTTLKAVACLKQADVVVYDRLADDRLLSFTRQDVELIYVGKASSQHTLRQQDINKLLVEKALEGKTVVRLKGGDPFVFGRGGEEALELVAHDIEFEIVPGITSAIAVPSYAGIPVTHRGIATSFAVITGHEDPNKPESTIKWDKLALGVDTLVFLMGVENLPHITKKLMEHGRNPNTPAAVIRWGTKPSQVVLTTTVERAAQDVADAGIKPPAIFIVGEVVNLREQLTWFDNKPLFGKRVIVTRSREQASELTARLEALGAECVELPAINIEPVPSYAELDKAIVELGTYQWLIFTSVNGVKYFFERLAAAGGDARKLAQLKVAAIGTGTAAYLKNFGIKADIIPLEFRAEGILEALKDEMMPGTRILIPRAQVARDVLPQGLTALGAEAVVVPAYRTMAHRGNVDLAELKNTDYITFTSSSTVTNFLEITGVQGRQILQKAKIACIGPITAATCVEHDVKPAIIAQTFTINGLVEAIIKDGEESI